MKKSIMMDILACPIDKHHPLEIFPLSESGDAVSDGALYCTKCSRFYCIMEGIPVMLPDDMRDQKKEMAFLAQHSESLPPKITRHGNPWHL